MKEEILQTALRHYLTHGIREMSNYRLVEILGISTKTLYKYFTSKEELLEETLHLFYSRQFRLLEERVEDQPAIPLILDLLGGNMTLRVLSSMTCITTIPNLKKGLRPL